VEENVKKVVESGRFSLNFILHFTLQSDLTVHF